PAGQLPMEAAAPAVGPLHHRRHAKAPHRKLFCGHVSKKAVVGGFFLPIYGIDPSFATGSCHAGLATLLPFACAPPQAAGRGKRPAGSSEPALAAAVVLDGVVVYP